jgi:hypothetical protein
MHRKDSGHTQRSEILAKLINAQGARVPLPEIVACAAQYGSRIFELRRMGFNILNERQRVDGELHTWFRLLPEPTNREFQQKSEPGGAPEHTLFGDLSPMRYPD